VLGVTFLRQSRLHQLLEVRARALLAAWPAASDHGTPILHANPRAARAHKHEHRRSDHPRLVRAAGLRGGEWLWCCAAGWSIAARALAVEWACVCCSASTSRPLVPPARVVGRRAQWLRGCISTVWICSATVRCWSGRRPTCASWRLWPFVGMPLVTQEATRAARPAMASTFWARPLNHAHPLITCLRRDPVLAHARSVRDWATVAC